MTQENTYDRGRKDPNQPNTSLIIRPRKATTTTKRTLFTNQNKKHDMQR